MEKTETAYPWETRHVTGTGDAAPARPSTEAELMRLSERLGFAFEAGLSESEARRRIALLHEVENA
ncbi:hypothetical protein [Seohaeicola zhoushanensis]|uniref:Uncharacterized protein n=1 Tax=Seohaeicola zhoushanensis TaxID=1569283 RepID=A0A8J3GZZ9_9RHOB|nr:hypothetical protein [Seohaeicola zhoushanensis]GHF60894.1 hypothetical protein GCM10017056_35360 [Seohaeicola zhoushanensis]